MTDCVFSIIIPAYNAEKYISRCLESILCQTLDKCLYEIIVVDDASIDGTVKEVEKYRAKYSSIELIRHQINRKQGAARNTGLQWARGRYTIFVDADDTLKGSDSLERIKAMLEMNQVQILRYVDMPKVEGDVEFTTGKRFIFNNPGFGVHVWNTVYETDYIRLITPFVEGHYYEDTRWMTEAIYNAKRMAVTNYSFYNYRPTANSVTRQVSDKKRMDMTLSEVETKRFIETLPIDATREVLEMRLCNSVINAPYSCRQYSFKTTRQTYELYKNNDMFSFYTKPLKIKYKLRLLISSILRCFIFMAGLYRMMYLLKAYIIKRKKIWTKC